jgi:hypothetical protein
MTHLKIAKKFTDVVGNGGIRRSIVGGNKIEV